MSPSPNRSLCLSNFVLLFVCLEIVGRGEVTAGTREGEKQRQDLGRGGSSRQEQGGEKQRQELGVGMFFLAGEVGLCWGWWAFLLYWTEKQAGFLCCDSRLKGKGGTWAGPELRT